MANPNPETRTRPDAFGIFAYVVYILVGGLLVFAFAQSLDGALETQERSVCRALSPEVRSRVHGVVLDASGNPVAGATITAPDDGSMGPRTGASGDDGRFEIFLPEGEQTLVVVAGDRKLEGTLTLEGSVEVEVEARLPKSGMGGELSEIAREEFYAPEVEAKDLQGNPFNLSDFRGKFVVLNFWATWCEPCITEWPQFDQLVQRLGDRDDVVIVAVSIDDEPEKIAPFLKRMGLGDTEVAVLWDPTQAVHRRFGSSKIPDTFFVDEDGRLVHAFVNVRKWGAPEAFHCVDGMAGR